MLPRRLLALIGVLLFAGLDAVAAQALPKLSELTDGWTRLYPSERTSCALGEAYFFLVRPGNPEKLMIDLRGGGGCGDYGSCLRGGYVSSLVADSASQPDRDASGWYDLEHPDNPVRDFTMVQVSYCTGDSHLGDRDFTYRRPTDWPNEGDPPELVVRHRGAVNVRAVLDWLTANIPAPRQVFVTGTSAGGIGSPFWVGPIAIRYPEARVSLLARDAGGYRGAPKDHLNPTGSVDVVRSYPGFEDVTYEELSVARLFVGAARAHPGVRLAMVNTAGDRAQAIRILHTDIPLSRLMDENVAEIRAADSDFVEFRAGGNEHGVDPYANAVRGVRLADWVRDYIDGRPVESLVCDDCTTPELRFTASDLDVLERAAELLSEELRWNPEDRGGCEDDERERRWSLYCALVRASVEVTGRSGPYWAPDAAVQALVYGTPLGDPEERALPRLWRWGNDPATDYPKVRSVLQATIARVRVSLVSAAYEANVREQGVQGSRRSNEALHLSARFARRR